MIWMLKGEAMLDGIKKLTICMVAAGGALPLPRQHLSGTVPVSAAATARSWTLSATSRWRTMQSSDIHQSEVTNMRYKLIGIILVVLFSFVTLPAAHAQKVVYLIRHAEQVLDVENPPLTEAGHQRAKAWATVLWDANIKVIYTSEKRRTKQTGKPIAQALNVPMKTMPRRDVSGLVDRLRTRHADDAILIVGHSYTIPKLIDKLGRPAGYPIRSEDYGSLFIVVPQSGSEPLVSRLHFK